MRLKEKLLLLVILGIAVSVIIVGQFNTRNVPETVFIRVVNTDGSPETNAFCRADIITETRTVNDKILEPVDSIFDYINPSDAVGPDKGYYKLETGLSKQDKTFEIKIVCINPGATGVSYTILNETNIPCEIKGDYLVC